MAEMPHDKEVIEYINTALKQGHTAEQIAGDLVSEGLDEQYVTDKINQVSSAGADAQDNIPSQTHADMQPKTGSDSGHDTPEMPHDKEVIEYINAALTAGHSQKQIVNDLVVEGLDEQYVVGKFQEIQEAGSQETPDKHAAQSVHDSSQDVSSAVPERETGSSAEPHHDPTQDEIIMQYIDAALKQEHTPEQILDDLVGEGIDREHAISRIHKMMSRNQK